VKWKPAPGAEEKGIAACEVEEGQHGMKGSGAEAGHAVIRLGRTSNASCHQQRCAS